MRIDNLSDADRLAVSIAATHSLAFACRKADSLGLPRSEFVRFLADGILALEQENPAKLREALEEFV